jgi:hypothetical protein
MLVNRICSPILYQESIRFVNNLCPFSMNVANEYVSFTGMALEC